MIDVLQDATIDQLRDLRSFINCSTEYEPDIKQQLTDTLTDRISSLNLQQLMEPMVKEYIQKRKERVIMDKQILKEALANVEAMTVDEFEAECIKAGYTPERKEEVIDSEKAWGYPTLELTEAAKGMRVVIDKTNHTLTTTDCSKDTVIFTVRKSRGEFNV